MAKPRKTASSRKVPARTPEPQQRPLTERERAFVLLIVAGGITNAEAYRRAGYSPRGATAGASRLLAQTHIIDAIAIMRREAQARKQVAHDRQSAAVNQLLSSSIEAATNSPRLVDAAELELRKSIDAEVAATISADYGDAILVENLEIAMGRKPQKRTIIIRQKGKGEDGKPLPPLTIQTEVYEHDGAVVNRALEILYDRIAQREGSKPRGLDAEALPAAARDALAAFRRAAGND